MGSLIYDKSAAVDVDDRRLAHLQIVILTKVRRSESFALEIDDGDRLGTFWISEHTPLEFRYVGNRQPIINHLWLEELAAEAGLHGVLRITPEPPIPDA